ncbi:hypothetical protein E3N88_11314 [Mikania micrantha]|uniref:Uncharacterized protein n=1 Tax=Mikania micrantha TaxID=192012 RepID=A0A5N6PDD8_9ASTR|nr:hypothetical protein E3N88_41614 [Mikania micrantha]KAD6120043.1 hypothetical protein E3N88_11314 [Mikania micrantha]
MVINVNLNGNGGEDGDKRKPSGKKSSKRKGTMGVHGFDQKSEINHQFGFVVTYSGYDITAAIGMRESSLDREFGTVILAVANFDQIKSNEERSAKL